MTAARVHAICWLALVEEVVRQGETWPRSDFPEQPPRQLRMPSDLLWAVDHATWAAACGQKPDEAEPWAVGQDALDAREAWRVASDALSYVGFYSAFGKVRRLAAVRRAIAALEAQP